MNESHIKQFVFMWTQTCSKRLLTIFISSRALSIALCAFSWATDAVSKASLTSAASPKIEVAFALQIFSYKNSYAIQQINKYLALSALSLR
jgi:hypothetical protein